MVLITPDFSPGSCTNVDDVCMYSKTWDEHMILIKEVFQRLGRAGLTVRPSKCMFGYSLVEFIGHRIGVDTLMPRTEKVDDVLKIASPRTKREVRAFLAMAGYYARFIPKFANIAYPLTQLTKKEAVFKWGEEQKEAFNSIKGYLSAEPVLKIIDFDRGMYIQTDASDIGIGAALLQKYGEVLHPVRFISRKLKSAECNDYKGQV